MPAVLTAADNATNCLWLSFGIPSKLIPGALGRGEKIIRAPTTGKSHLKCLVFKILWKWFPARPS